jgi:hypothetical protein
MSRLGLQKGVEGMKSLNAETVISDGSDQGKRAAGRGVISPRFASDKQG